MTVILSPKQAVWLATAVTIGNGRTVIVNVLGKPTQPKLDVAVTEIVATWSVVPVFMPAKFKLPVPDAAKPMLVFEFVHAYVSPV